MQLILSTLCLGLTSAVIGNAYVQKKQFYPAVVYITKSNASMAVIYIQFFVIVFMFGKLLRKIFLGTLRAAEFEHLLERFWYALTETCLAFTVFRDDFNPRFVALFTVLLFLKSFHWLAEERVDFMERSPVLGWLFHIRVASLLTVLGVLDYLLLVHAYDSTLIRGPTVQLVFGFEYAILLTVVASTAIKYVLHAAEMRTDTPWENKAVFLLYTELVIGLIKVVLYILFVVIMAKIYALPMFVFRPMFFTIRNFKKALSDVIMSRRAIRNMNTLYPDATAEELRLSDNICIICREDMVNHSKKLPCGHIFHTTCLRSWFQRQQTCPTCRLNILRTPATNSTAMPRPEDQAAAAPGVAPAPGAGAAPNAPQIPIQTEPLRADAANPILGGFDNVAGVGPLPGAFPMFGAGMTPPPMNIGTAPPFMMPPPFPFVAPYAVPPPPMPSDLSNFTIEELRSMEGNERRNVEERLKLLRNIQTMLDAASILFNNYQIVATRSQIPVPAAPDSTTPSAASRTAPSVLIPGADEPSTSAAAGLSVGATAAPNITPINSTSSGQQSHTTAPIIKQPVPSNYNEINIEDVGVDDPDERVPKNNNAMASISTLITPTTASAEHADNSELSELRKRRLKFLDERNKTSPPPE